MIRAALLASILAGCNTPVIEAGPDQEVTQLPNGGLLIRARRQVEPQVCYVRSRFIGVLVPMDCDQARLVNVR